MTLHTVQKLWMAGSTLCVTVPKDVKSIMKLEAGDYIQVSWEKVVGKSDNAKPTIKKKLRKKEGKEAYVIEEEEDEMDEFDELPDIK